MSDPRSPTAHTPQPTPRIKICGTTSVHDAVLSGQAGADALGFIFAPVSKRLVSAAVAREAGLCVGPAVGRVGVFLDQGLDEVLRTAEAARVSAVQLHGPLSEGFVRAVTDFYPVLRVLAPAEVAAGAQLWADVPAVTLMLDAPQPGGGVALDWKSLRADFPRGTWLAGGLGPWNVAEAIRVLRPAAVDAVSHLEARPGVKDSTKVAAFVAAVREAAAESYPQ